MATVVCTGFSKEGYGLYGKNFLRTFDRFWPHGVKLVAFAEEPVPMPRGECRLLVECEGLTSFIERHKGIPEHCGTGPLPQWKPKDRRKGYSFRFDCVKFCKQLFYPEAAAKRLEDGDYLAWFDGDVVFFDNVPSGFIETMLGEHELCYLGRHAHSEIGFWAVRLNAATRAFLSKMASMYRTDEVFTLAETHSAFVFDHCREGLNSRNHTPGGHGNVWLQSPLARWSNHLKGALKTAA